MSSNSEFWIIRPYQTSDRDEVVALWDSVFRNPADHNQPQRIIDTKLKVQRELFFVAALKTDTNKIVGTALAGYDGHRGWLYQVAVNPEYRKRGLGRALIQHAQATLMKLGCEKVNLQVRSENHEVVAFYEKLGFTSEPRVSLGKRLS